MERAVFVYTTWPSTVEAEAAGRALVERRLAACVNILPGMISLYWWEGKVERAEEAVMIVKTRASLADAVSDAVKELHSYDTPAILVMPLESVEKNYLGWLLAATERRREIANARQRRRRAFDLDGGGSVGAGALDHALELGVFAALVLPQSDCTLAR